MVVTVVMEVTVEEEQEEERRRWRCRGHGEGDAAAWCPSRAVSTSVPLTACSSCRACLHLMFFQCNDWDTHHPVFMPEI